jgi:hypothetical protein
MFKYCSIWHPMIHRRHFFKFQAVHGNICLKNVIGTRWIDTLFSTVLPKEWDEKNEQSDNDDLVSSIPGFVLNSGQGLSSIKDSVFTVNGRQTPIGTYRTHFMTIPIKTTIA